MKIVQFENGQLALRKGNWLFGYEYLDLKDNAFWWKQSSDYFSECLTNDIIILNDYIKKHNIKIMKHIIFNNF